MALVFKGIFPGKIIREPPRRSSFRNVETGPPRRIERNEEFMDNMTSDRFVEICHRASRVHFAKNGQGTRRNGSISSRFVSFIFVRLIGFAALFLLVPTLMAAQGEKGGLQADSTGTALEKAPSALPRKPIFTIPVPARDNAALDRDAEKKSAAALAESEGGDSASGSDDVEKGEKPIDNASSSEKLGFSETSPENGDAVSEGGADENASSAPYDPIKENGRYFTGWDKPDLALVLTGLLEGYIEPCGCAGMDRMKGGLSRRASFIKDLKKKGWPVIAVDAGLIADGYGFQEELKLDMAMNAFYLMDYSAVGISQKELRFPAHYLLKHTVPPSPEEQSLFVSANIGVYGFLDLYTLPYKTVEKNGIRIGITSVIDTRVNASVDEKILTKPAEERLNEILPAMKRENCGHLILIAHGSEKFVEGLAEKFPDFDIIITGDSPTAPPSEPRRTDRGQFIVEVGEKGKYAVVLGIFGETVRYQRVALDSRFQQSKDVHLLMAEYQDVLRGIVETKGYKGLSLTAVESPNRPLLGDYVGSAQCESCHEESYNIWRDNRHSQAWKSISQVPPTEHSADPPRDCDPECVSCHVIGWNGQEHLPYIGGFTDMKATPHLANVGCESCHGPGSKHIAAELGNDETARERLRSAMRLGDSAKQVCYSCHDADNSPNFDFDSYYKIIEHSENLDDEDDEEEETSDDSVNSVK